MNQKDDFIKSGFQLLETENSDSKLLAFLKENYPGVISDNELNLNELKAILNLLVDEKVNGYGLNFVGRNVARAKYAQPTEKEVKINKELSKNFEATKNMVLKGDNLDSLKILKHYYTDKIKCIYIDPPYNTANDNFIYPDKFDREEAEVLGLANISEIELERMEFSFKNKKSHNGWLSFMYPRLLLARDLLSKDGVIFISIDDNEQANLKLLCDEVFGEENFIECLKWKRKKQPSFLAKHTAKVMEYILVYSKNFNNLEKLSIERISDSTKKIINLTNPYSERIFSKGVIVKLGDNGVISKGVYIIKTMKIEYMDDIEFKDGKTIKDIKVKAQFSVSQEKIDEYIKEGLLFITVNKGLRRDINNNEKKKKKSITDLLLDWGDNQDSDNEMKRLFNENYFEYSKPVKLISNIIKSVNDKYFTILDFFAGSGTTGHAVMQLNAEDGGNRKFILCQIDEPISKEKPAYQFCVENNLPPVISSITVERLKRGGDKIATQIAEENSKDGLFQGVEKQIPDVGFKTFDSIDAPKLILENEQVSIKFEQDDDSLSRIYNMIFSVGIDDPTYQVECIKKDCIYKTGDNHYIINSEKVNKDEFSAILRKGKIFIDGWSANINTTLQNYKEDVKIVF
ncbi:adenine-specific DNA-methyltransferase [Chryseobacterium sp. SORGH_AS 447]|uniref:site-specific DNA-methyltransferase n=1 Tax=Chryseobacterium sp. SORGH_AS_0447 TaxID=3041769 RepID=UPI002787DF5C|nr:site-specific DNA-methyltransferase [Chryseobacterium sp. SORGH_AS_0447]MDQ1162830.1 adenine-specific DNA-methyltransferase [Chryseobacterium sp. SORGH_AS_0447]